MKAILKKHARRQRRKKHVRKRILGSSDRPRLTVFRSHKNIYAQIIDDMAGHTLVAASSTEKNLAEKIESHCGNKQAAAVVGETLAAKAIDAGIKRVVFDRNGYAFHGRIRELVDAARKGGLEV